MDLSTKREGPRNLGFVLSDAGGLSYDTVTIAAGSGVLKPGTLLGKITAGGKRAPSPAAEVEDVEGAETALEILAYGVDATTADVEAVVLARLAEVKRDMLVFDASVDTSPEIAAKHTQLAAAHIIVR
ncbi:head decoration protein [Paracoccus sp. (in: a-proteobacteria)]|uniref:head decoration protein n=1 Tax=Paracoccus sp. TaxID=267 RepID=UPI002AFFBFFF|nr:head decoration protein [Paracoccus sp. (in: a-proteobacteria)]